MAKVNRMREQNHIDPKGSSVALTPPRSIFIDVIPLVTSDRDLAEALGRQVREARPDGGVQEVKPPEALDFLGSEMPELFFLDFNDPSFDAFDLLETSMADPWLHYSGILALCDDQAAVERLENDPRANIILVVGTSDLETLLPRLLRILENNQRLLFQRHAGTDFASDVTGQVRLANDVLEIRCYQNLVCNYLHNTNRIGTDTKAALNLAINEMLMNAIEHGNCGISYEEKSAWLEDGHTIAELIAKRCQDPKIAGRRVVFEYTVAPDCSRFRVADEGAGFDWRALHDPVADDNVLKRHGRGILMTRAFTNELTYNEKGNEVRFEIRHAGERDNPTPALFEGIEAHDVEVDEVVLRQGEISTSLYYIVKGRYDVFVDNRLVTTLTPDDLLMGEISCLLGSRRTATIKARTAGRLVEITKRKLLEVIRERPYYALVLSRLLAGRLAAQTRSPPASSRSSDVAICPRGVGTRSSE